MQVFASSLHSFCPIFSRACQDAWGRFQQQQQQQQHNESSGASWTRAVHGCLSLPRSASPTLPASPQRWGHSTRANPEEPELQNRGTSGSRPFQPWEHRIRVQAGARVCKYNASICWITQFNLGTDGCVLQTLWQPSLVGFVKDSVPFRQVDN